MRGCDLTPGQRDRIADLLRMGIDRAVIATRMGISPRSVTRIATALRRAQDKPREAIHE